MPLRLIHRSDAELRLHAAGDPALRSKISGPLLDRLDLHIEVPAVPFRDLTIETKDETSDVIRKRVMAAREFQRI